MAQEAKIDYDEENDILYVYSGEEAKDSLEIDNFVIDISANNKVVGVEIFNASILLSKLMDIEISKESLSNIQSAKMQFYQSKELFYVLVFLGLTIGNEQKEIQLQVPTPSAVIVQ